MSTGEIDLSLKVKNQTNQSVYATITGVITPGNIEFSQQVLLDAESTDSIVFNKNSFAQLIINDPLLWWPNGYGNPNLYNCQLNCSVNGVLSDSTSIRFGIREYSYDTEGGVLHVSVNGTRVFLKGGNWGMSEYMLRCRGDEYKTKLRLHKEMNYNMIRNWTGAVTDDEFYEQCDENGIMLWDDFWLITTYITWPRSPQIFEDNVIEKIKRRRNYACVAIWCGMNEFDPTPEFIEIYEKAIAIFDNNDRHFQPNSNKGNLSGSGWWVNFTPEEYFTTAHGGTYTYGLRSEIGTAVFTTFDSFKEFMPEENWWPRNEMWNKHFFGPNAAGAGPDHYFESVESRYGTATGIEDFCKKAQILNIETNKAIYESWQHHMWNDASGVLIWMSQSAYPSFVWQTYDYYYDLTGAYWGAKKACEPIHIQWDAARNMVEVVNASRTDYSNLTAKLKVFNLDGTQITSLDNSVVVNSGSNSVTSCFSPAFTADNLAEGKPAYSSSDENSIHTADKATDGIYAGDEYRWSSSYNDNEWIYVDLESVQPINQVNLFWEASYGTEYKIQVSNDAFVWSDVIHETNGNGGTDEHTFETVDARYVRMFGIQRVDFGWAKFGFSLFEIEVLHNNDEAVTLDSVHFLQLELLDEEDKKLSDNFYWRSTTQNDFSALNSLEEVVLDIAVTDQTLGSKKFVEAVITNPTENQVVAFANYIKVVNATTGERILPALISDGYFSLMPGESKTITIEFDEALLNGADYRVLATPYNGQEEAITTEIKENDKKLQDFMLYPNPVDDILYLKGLNGDAQIEIFSLNGQKIKLHQGNQVDVSQLNPGYYLVRVTQANQVKVEKFIKR